MKKLLPRIALAGMLCVAGTAVFAQDKANSEVRELLRTGWQG
jgi:hypothetical protein